MAMTTLAYERGGVANLHLGLRGKIRRLLDEAQGERARPTDPVLRQTLARALPRGRAAQAAVSDRAISGALHGRDARARGSSIAKLVWSEAEQHLAEVAGDVLGADANTGDWGRDRVYMRALTDRRRHHPGEQEHPRPAHPGTSARRLTVDARALLSELNAHEAVNLYFDEAAATRRPRRRDALDS